MSALLARLLGVFAVCALGALLGDWLGGWSAGHSGAAWGFALAALALVVWDSIMAVRMAAFFQAPEQPQRFWGLWAEVHERAQRVFALRRRETQEQTERLDSFMSAIQNSPSGVILLDKNNCIEYFNATALAHFGLDGRRDLLQLVTHLIRDPGLAAVLPTQQFDAELVVNGPNATPTRPVRLAVKLHAFGAQRKLMMSRDVTVYEQAEAMRRDFVANVSHEIRTPLTVLRGFVETMQNVPLGPPDQLRYLGLMSAQSARMEALVADLLTLSKLEGDAPPPLTEWMDVNSMMQKLEREVRAMGARSHDLVFKLGARLELDASPLEAESAIMNLITNALRYTPPGKRITIEVLPATLQVTDGAALTPAGLQLRVSDEGPGIASHHLGRLTERFYRADASRSLETGGTGLGLAIVKHVMQRHGGSLRIESELGAGATFTLLWPAQRVRAVAAHAALATK